MVGWDEKKPEKKKGWSLSEDSLTITDAKMLKRSKLSAVMLCKLFDILSTIRIL